MYMLWWKVEYFTSKYQMDCFCGYNMDDYILWINGLLQHMDLMDKFVEFRILVLVMCAKDTCRPRNYPGPADR